MFAKYACLGISSRPREEWEPRHMDALGILSPCSIHFIDIIADISLEERVGRLSMSAELSLVYFYFWEGQIQEAHSGQQ